VERAYFEKLLAAGCSPSLSYSPVALEPHYKTPSHYDRSKIDTCYFKLVSSVSDEVVPETSEKLLKLLQSVKEPLSFEIIGSANETVCLIVCQRRDRELIQSSFETTYKNIYVRELEADPFHAHYKKVKKDGIKLKFYFLDFYLPQPFFFPIATFKTNFSTDPLEQIYHALSNLKEDELGFYQVLLMPCKTNWQKLVRDLLSAREVIQEQQFERLYVKEIHPFLSDPELKHYSQMAQDKLDPRKPLFAASIRVGIFAHPDRFAHILKVLKSAMNSFSMGERSFQCLTRNDYFDQGVAKKDHLYLFFNRVAFREGMLLNSAELSGLCHLPTPDVLLNSDYHLETLPRSVRVPASLNDGVTLGVNIYRGKKQDVKLNEYVRNKHLYIVGKTRTGKSTLMFNLIHQDILSNECVAVIEPEGDLIDEVLDVIPKKRIDDVIYLNAGDKNYPASFNMLHAGRHRDRGKLANDIIDTFEKLFDGNMGDRMRRILRSCLLSLLHLPDSTLKDIELFLINDAFREKILEYVSDYSIKNYWRYNFPQQKKLLWSSVDAILTRLDGFLGDETVRNITCQRQTKIDFDEILEKKKIFLCNLNTKIIGKKNASILGQLLVSELQIAGMHREKGIRKNIYFYVDEFQNYITPDFETLLSQGAKYRVNLCLANQYIEQLKELKGAVFGNPGTIVTFRLGERDAPILAKEFGIFSEHDIMHLPNYHTLVKVEDKCFTMVTNPAPRSEYSFRDEIIQKSREHYSAKRSDVEKDFNIIRYIKEDTKIEIKKPVPEPKEVPEKIEPQIPTLKKASVPKKEKLVTEKTPGKGGPEHKYLQALIKKAAQDNNYLAVIEKEIAGGSVDISLEHSGIKIACEISVTSHSDYELSNIKKCIEAGFNEIILCSQKENTLEKIKEAVFEKLAAEDQEKILYFQPEALIAYLEEKAAQLGKREETVRGYKVKTRFKPVSEEQKKAKQEAVTKVILESMRRLKK
jgi:hypothetical protein